MIHKLCKNCVNDCKQTAVVIIARCPKYIRRVSESEFRNLLDDLDEMGKKADELRVRTKKLVETALEHQGSGTKTVSDNSDPNETGSMHDMSDTESNTEER